MMTGHSLSTLHDSARISIAPGSVVVVRDEEWLVTGVEHTTDGRLLRCQGLSELVRDTTASFYEGLDAHRRCSTPPQATVVADDSPLLPPLPALARGDAAQDRGPARRDRPDGLRRHARRPARLPAGRRPQGPRPGEPPHAHPARRRGGPGQDAGDRHDPGRADPARPGRADPDRHAPARARADAARDVVAVRDPVRPAGLARASSGSGRSCPPPVTRSPTSSGSSSRSTRSRASSTWPTCDSSTWDAVVIDESHNVTNSGDAEQPARPGAGAEHRRADPRLGHPAQRQGGIVRRADPPAGADRRAPGRHGDRGRGAAPDHPAAPAQPRGGQRGRRRLGRAQGAAELAGARLRRRRTRWRSELDAVWLHPAAGTSPYSGAASTLFPWTLAKAFLSSPAALLETIRERIRRLGTRPTAGQQREIEALRRLEALAAQGGRHELRQVRQAAGLPAPDRRRPGQPDAGGDLRRARPHAEVAAGAPAGRPQARPATRWSSCTAA